MSEKRIKALELKGLKSVRALNSYSILLMGLKMIPEYAHLTYEEFLSIINAMEPEDQRKIFKTAVKLVNMEPDDVKALCVFCADSNGVPYTSENMHKLALKDILEIMVEVCMAIASIKIDMISEDQKKN